VQMLQLIEPIGGCLLVEARRQLRLGVKLLKLAHPAAILIALGIDERLTDQQLRLAQHEIRVQSLHLQEQALAIYFNEQSGRASRVASR